MASHQLIRRYVVRLGATAVAAFALMVGTYGGASAAVDAYITFDGIQGTRPDNSIEVMSFSWGQSRNIGSATGGAGAGKSRMNDLTITKRTDVASPKLWQACASGKHFPMVKFVSGAETIIFSDVMIDNCRKSGGANGIPTETCTLSYEKYAIAGAPTPAPRSLEMRLNPIAPAVVPPSGAPKP